MVQMSVSSFLFFANIIEVQFDESLLCDSFHIFYHVVFINYQQSCSIRRLLIIVTKRFLSSLRITVKSMV